MLTYLWIAIGGALGSMARYGCGKLAVDWFGESFPWGTLFINVLGSFVIGAFATMTEPDGRLMVSQEARLFVIVGVCGGFTTFSSFSLQTLSLVRSGNMVGAGLNIIGSVVLCLVAVWLGYLAGGAFNHVKG